MRIMQIGIYWCIVVWMVSLRNLKLIFCLLLFRLTGLQRSMSILIIARQYKESKATTVTTQSHTQDLTDSIQSARRTRTPGWLLFKSRRLVGTKCSCRWSWKLRLFMERMYKSSKLINIAKWKYSVVGCGTWWPHTNILSHFEEFFLWFKCYKTLITIHLKLIKRNWWNLSKYFIFCQIGDAFMWSKQWWQYSDISFMEWTWWSTGSRYSSWLCNGLGCASQ